MAVPTTASHRTVAARGCPFAGNPSGAAPAVATAAPAPHPVTVRALPGDPLAAARTVTREVRRNGKHALPASLRHALAQLRRSSAAGPFAAAFLDCLLDKHDDRFHNRTYLALALLEGILDDPRARLDPVHLSALLMADVVRFESRVAARPPRPGDDRPDRRTLRTRLAHARRFLAACGVPDGAALPAPPAGELGDWFAMTVQPVSVVHDEYMFIRALQCHELVFTGTAARVRTATTALRAGEVASARWHVDSAVRDFERASLLFRVVATMRPAAFHTFREYTQGASAIQSVAYKRFEIACGRPREERLRSDAFGNVPDVLAQAQAGPDDLTAAYLETRPAGGGREWDRLDAALRELERRHQKWKVTHHGLAARMLGEAAGSGYPEGVPYLRRCLDQRLFWQLPLAA